MSIVDYHEIYPRECCPQWVINNGFGLGLAFCLVFWTVVGAIVF